MSWLGLIIGLVVGGAIGKVPGALALGFLGWLVGFIISSMKKAAPEASVADRLDALERRLATLERRMQGTPVAPPREETPVKPLAAPIPVMEGSLDLTGEDMGRTGEFPTSEKAPAPPPPPRPPPPPKEPSGPNP